MMKQERALQHAGVSKVFGTWKFEVAASLSFTMALLINFVSITTLTYSSQDSNATVLQWSPPFLIDANWTTAQLQGKLKRTL